MKSTNRFCDGVTRRDLVRVGLLSGLGLSLPEFFRLQEAQAAPAAPKRDVSCIFLWLQGGPSHLDMWDMKPDAPAEFRGEFKPIRTNVPGIEICEHLPQCAQVQDKYTILRTVTHPDSGHGKGAHVMQTGLLPGPGFDEGAKAPGNIHPAFGSVVAQQRGIRQALPPYISMPGYMSHGGPAFLGAAYAPFTLNGDPASPDFSVKDIQPPLGVDAARALERQALLETVNGRFKTGPQAAASERIRSLNTFYQKAQALVSSPEAQKAFDISQEPARVREAYGPSSLGQSCLLARRLVEAGARFVSIDHGNWDSHTTIFPTLKDDLLPQFDAGFAALLRDLDERGMLATTLVVVCGEFGRTPRINKDGGRDHWPNTTGMLLAGGGLKNGVALGKSDARAEFPTERPITPEEVAATIYKVLGVDHERQLMTPLGRPVQIVSNGKPIRELI